MLVCLMARLGIQCMCNGREGRGVVYKYAQVRAKEFNDFQLIILPLETRMR